MAPSRLSTGCCAALLLSCSLAVLCRLLFLPGRPAVQDAEVQHHGQQGGLQPALPGLHRSLDPHRCALPQSCLSSQQLPRTHGRPGDLSIAACLQHASAVRARRLNALCVVCSCHHAVWQRDDAGEQRAPALAWDCYHPRLPVRPASAKLTSAPASWLLGCLEPAAACCGLLSDLQSLSETTCTCRQLQPRRLPPSLSVLLRGPSWLQVRRLPVLPAEDARRLLPGRGHGGAAQSVPVGRAGAAHRHHPHRGRCLRVRPAVMVLGGQALGSSCQ